MLKRFHLVSLMLAFAYLANVNPSLSAAVTSSTSGSLPGSSTSPGSSSLPGAKSSIGSSSLPGATTSVGSGTAPGSSTIQGTSTPKSTITPLEPYKEHHEPLLRPPESGPEHHPLIQTKPPIRQTPVYFHPGMLLSPRGGGIWEGGDHLLNLSNTIGVFVEIIKPQDDKLNITENQIQKIVDGIFNQGGITPETRAAPDRPPLPFFHIQILCYPVSRGYVVCCSGRLFESVDIRRVVLDPDMAFQAITWEKQTLFVAPTEGVIQEIEKNVVNIAQSFVERFQSYEQRRRDLLRAPSF